MTLSNHLQAIQHLFEIYYQNDDKMLNDLFLTLKSDLITLKHQNNPTLITKILTHLASEIGCTDDLERCELMLDELINKKPFNQNELIPFWDNLHLRQG